MKQYPEQHVYPKKKHGFMHYSLQLPDRGNEEKFYEVNILSFVQPITKSLYTTSYRASGTVLSDI